ncbi:MAG: DUF853 family protein [Chloroflexi bacterium]|nr:DUF853 family protein [Chloroflexota bacterium]MBU1746432.1 DUF853 family protein [Chloroflexota bacterium]
MSHGFYLGRRFDLKAGQLTDEPLTYDPRDLTTHGVIVGMTGSGKTGLAIDLLEEAALAGLPALIIDPKGDVSNLLLAFPDLRPADFRPWVNPDDARRAGLDLDAYAEQVAATWRDGLAEWGLGPDDVRRLCAAADFSVYTPGSDAGTPVSILHSLEMPPGLSWDQDGEALRERIGGTVTALLGLVGVEADPLRSREHILLANIFEHAWRAGEALDLARLIAYVQQPPFARLGVVDRDQFFPPADRLAFALQLNGIAAAPGFQYWMTGDPLDVGALLDTSGKPRVSVFYIAHLTDAERMFFVALLLNQVWGWLRSQPGTTGLRGLIYFDEVFGYLPPYPANPPSKLPLLTLLKQARAFGLGLVLCTQNPVDLDYKALSNAGTWFVGRLQTERDKARLLDGLESVTHEAGEGFDRAAIDRLIAGLRTRVFLLHNVHAKGGTLAFNTRWAMSYLRGPLTKDQIRTLVREGLVREGLVRGEAKQPAAKATAAPPPPVLPSPPPEVAPLDAPGDTTAIAPQPADRLSVFYLRPRVTPAEYSAALRLNTGSPVELVRAGAPVYRPYLYASARLTYQRARPEVYHTEEVSRVASADRLANWDVGQATVADDELAYAPLSGEVRYAPLDRELTTATGVRRLETSFKSYVQQSAGITVFHNPRLKDLKPQVGESRDEFLRRADAEADRLAEVEAVKLRAKYETQAQRLEAKLIREEQELAEDRLDHDARKREEMFSGLETVGHFIFGRKPLRSISTAATKRRMTQKAELDVQESEETITRLQADMKTLNAELEDEVIAIGQRYDDLATQVDELELRPARAGVEVQNFALLWVPTWDVELRVGDEVRPATVDGHQAPPVEVVSIRRRQ